MLNPVLRDPLPVHTISLCLVNKNWVLIAAIPLKFYEQLESLATIQVQPPLRFYNYAGDNDLGFSRSR